jgi:hypothetical protein
VVKLGYRLNLFQRAANELYHQSLEGKQPAWVAEWLRRGQPEAERERGPLAEVIQPEVALTADGLMVRTIWYEARELSLAAALGEELAAAGFDVIGGAGGLRGPAPKPATGPLGQRMWLALFWMRPLHEFWRRELSDRQFAALQKAMPPAWLIDPVSLPPHAVVPGLEVNSWEEVARFGAERREELVLQPSRADSTGPAVAGGAVNAAEWREAIRRALAESAHAPWILQRSISAETLLWPYYFVREGRAELCGVLARTRVAPGEERVTLAAVA